MQCCAMRGAVKCFLLQGFHLLPFKTLSLQHPLQLQLPNWVMEAYLDLIQCGLRARVYIKMAFALTLQ